MRLRRWRLVVWVGTVFATATPTAGEFPYPSNPRPCREGENPSTCIRSDDFASYLFLPASDPPVVPNDFVQSLAWKLGSGTTGNPEIDQNPQELFGITGSSVDRAWQVTTGRPDVVIAILDSGIRWQRPLPDLVAKFYLNRGELPIPEGSTNKLDPWDRNGDGVFNIRDYESSAGWPQDSRVRDENDNGLLDPEDLIFLFSDGHDGDGNGYVDDISGWDFFEDDNDPLDEVDYGHGTGEAHDSTAEANNGGAVGTCPNCMALMVRVADSFVAEVNAFARGVLFAVDSGAMVIQEALGTLNHSSFGQAAIDYAYRRGVVVIASAADEESAHHNYPAAYERTVVVNSVTRYASLGGLSMSPPSYLYLNGCTNFGPHIALSVPSTACSSEATGLAAGVAGLVYSAARNEIDRGRLTRYRADDGKLTAHPLSTNEVKQILTQSADDVNFDARPSVGLPQSYQVVLQLPQGIGSQRFPSIAGFDQYFGYGRINARRAVEAVIEGRIPPEAEIASPLWFAMVSPDDGTLDIRGRVAANRAGSFQWQLAVAPGVQPREEEFLLVASGTEVQARVGLLGQIDVRALASRMPYGTSGGPVTEDGRPDPDRFTVTVRLRAIDDRGNIGEDRRAWFLYHDPEVWPGTPRMLGSDGAAAPVFAEITGDGVDDLVIATADGSVHVLTGAGLEEATGWPVYTDLMEVHSDSPAFRSGELPHPHAPILGTPAVGDLDRDGFPEVVAADLYGKVYVWDKSGRRRPGFPVRSRLEFSFPLRSEREGLPEMQLVPDRVHRLDSDNRLARGFMGGPVLGNLDGSADGSLEIIAGCMDRHIYAWFLDGRPVPGWPVLLKDPNKVASVDPITNRVRLIPGSGQRMGSKIVVPPSLGDIDGDGSLDVVASVNEAYRERPNAVITNVVVNFLQASGALESGNTRLYAVHSSGATRGANSQSFGWNPDAFLEGWPVRLAMLTTELLPVVGTGSNGPPALADLDGDSRLEVAGFSILGPAYVFRWTGESFLGIERGSIPRTLLADVFGAESRALDSPSYPALGAPMIAEMFGAGRGYHLLAPAAGLGKLLDANLPAQQFPAENHLALWEVARADGSPAEGKLAPAFPQLVNDLQFFVAPIAVDINGDGVAEAIWGSGVYDLRAVDPLGRWPRGWPKFTGGWSIGSPAAGDIDGDGTLEIAAVTREGYLFLFSTAGSRCGHLPWRQYHHDPWGSGNYHTDAWPPAPPVGRIQLVDTRQVMLLGDATPGDDQFCGKPARIELRFALAPLDEAAAFERASVLVASVAGTESGRSRRLAVSATLPSSLTGRVYLAARAEDERGNRSRIVAYGALELPTVVPTRTHTPTPAASRAQTPTPTSTYTRVQEAAVTATRPPGSTPLPTVTTTAMSPTPSVIPIATAASSHPNGCQVAVSDWGGSAWALLVSLTGFIVARKRTLRSRFFRR